MLQATRANRGAITSQLGFRNAKSRASVEASFTQLRRALSDDWPRLQEFQLVVTMIKNLTQIDDTPRAHNFMLKLLWEHSTFVIISSISTTYYVENSFRIFEIQSEIPTSKDLSNNNMIMGNDSPFVRLQV